MRYTKHKADSVTERPEKSDFSLRQRNRESQLFKGFDVSLFYSLGIYCGIVVSSQIHEMRIVFEDMVNCKSYAVRDCNDGSLAASSGSYLAVFCIEVTVLVANGGKSTFHQRGF